MARPSVPVAGGKGGGGATTSVGKRNAGRQSHVVAASNGHGNTGNSGNKEQESSNGETKQEQQQHSNKHQPHIEKSETVSKATGAAAATAQAVSKYHHPSSFPRVLLQGDNESWATCILVDWFLNI